MTTLSDLGDDGGIQTNRTVRLLYGCNTVTVKERELEIIHREAMMGCDIIYNKTE